MVGGDRGTGSQLPASRTGEFDAMLPLYKRKKERKEEEKRKEKEIRRRGERIHSTFYIFWVNNSKKKGKKKSHPSPSSHRKSKPSALVIQREHKENNSAHLNANLSPAKEIRHNGNRLAKYGMCCVRSS